MTNAGVRAGIELRAAMNVNAALRAFTLRHPVRERKLVAVSGGRDSVALLHGLYEAGHRNLVVCHLNHRLRGRAAGADAAFVRRLTVKLDLTFELAVVDVKKMAKEDGNSLETAGRRARHHFLAECARRHRCRLVLMAHHADDQAETVLFNLLRGSSGLRGMAPEMEIVVPGFRAPLSIKRPLLAVSRAAIDAWVTERGVAYREDATNAGADPVRNKLRNALLPALCEAMGRDVRPALVRAAEINSEEQAFLDGLSRPLAAAEVLEARELSALPVALQRRVIFLWLQRQEFPGTGFEEVESVRAMLDLAGGPARVNLPGNRFIVRHKAKLRALR